MEYRILGPLEVRDGKRTVEIPGLKERAVLGLLLVEAGTVVSADRMVFELWGEEPPPSALKSLRSHVSRLRRSLGPGNPVVTKRPGYLFDGDSVLIDSYRFEVLADEAVRLGSDPVAASDEATKALSLWRGPALADLGGFLFAENEARRLEERRLLTLEIRMKGKLDLGHHAEVIPELRLAVSEHPYHEPFWGHLMLALYRSGRAGDALEVFAELERTVGEAMGIGVSHDLRSLERSIVMEDRALDLPSSSPPHNLPATVTGFIGREKELRSLGETIRRARFLTLTGPGGSGKSRLALEAAGSVLDAFEDGVWRIELAPVTDPEALPSTVSAAFGEPASHAADPTESLIDYLKNRRILLLLDNCEHLLGASAELAARLLAHCPGMSLLATSREPLRVAGETVWLVPPLVLPDPDSPPDDQEEADSFRLFATRARESAPGFTVTDDNRAEIVEICRAVAGLPLAIELAASRIASFSPGQLLERIAEGLDVLVGSSRTALEHHRTMRAALHWSYRLLHPEHARVFRDLAVFRGGWTLDDAEAVLDPISGGRAGGIADALSDLVERSLVERLRGGGLHYRMLEPIREFALEMFETSQSLSMVCTRHADHYLALTEKADKELRGPNQIRWLQLMQAEHGNLRKAIQWALDSGRSDLALRLVAAAGWFWFMAGNWRESWQWVQMALERAGQDHDMERAAAIYRTGGIQVIRVNYAVVMPLLEVALAITQDRGDRYGEAWCLHLKGHAAAFQPSMESLEPLEEARAIFESLECDWEVAWSDRYIGAELCEGINPERGLQLQNSSISAFREMGDQWETAYGLYIMGVNLLGMTQYGYGPEAARPYYQRSLRLSEQLGDRVWSAHAINGLALCSDWGDMGDPEPLYVEASERLRLIGDDNCLSVSIGGLGDLRRRAGADGQAAEYYGEAIRIAKRINKRHGLASNYDRLALLALDRGLEKEARRLCASVERSLQAGELRYMDFYREMHVRVVSALGYADHDGETLDAVLPHALELAESIKDEALSVGS